MWLLLSNAPTSKVTFHFKTFFWSQEFAFFKDMGRDQGEQRDET